MSITRCKFSERWSVRKTCTRMVKPFEVASFPSMLPPLGYVCVCLLLAKEGHDFLYKHAAAWSMFIEHVEAL